MDGRSLDLARIKRALANLDKIAADHPELCGNGPAWTEDDVAEIIVDDAGAWSQSEAPSS